MRCVHLVVEGHGDLEAALNLVTRLARDLGMDYLFWAKPIRGKNLHQERGLHKVGALLRAKPNAGALLVLRDEDDGCPRKLAPATAGWLRSLNLPFPSAVVFAHREFEAFFLPCISRMAGKKLLSPEGIPREGLRKDTDFTGDPQAIRGVKEWLTDRMPRGHSYKPTLDQLALTRLIDFQVIRQAAPPLPCFGTLERSLQFLHRSILDGSKGTYPP